jgi:hypothetical protein
MELYKQIETLEKVLDRERDMMGYKCRESDSLNGMYGEFLSTQKDVEFWEKILTKAIGSPTQRNCIELADEALVEYRLKKSELRKKVEDIRKV